MYIHLQIVCIEPLVTTVRRDEVLEAETVRDFLKPQAARAKKPQTDRYCYDCCIIVVIVVIVFSLVVMIPLSSRTELIRKNRCQQLPCDATANAFD